jgi:hypothetical protein
MMFDWFELLVCCSSPTWQQNLKWKANQVADAEHDVGPGEAGLTIVTGLTGLAVSIDVWGVQQSTVSQVWSLHQTNSQTHIVNSLLPGFLCQMQW